MCLSPPVPVAGIAGGGSEGLAATVWMSDFEVILLPAQLLAQHPVGLVQLHKLAVQGWVGRVAVWMHLQHHVSRR